MKKVVIVGALILIVIFISEAAKLQRTQLWPSAARLIPDEKIKDFHIKRQFTNIKEWADKLQQMLDTTFRKVADVPFNQSESLTVTDTGNADTTKTATHHLGRKPNGLIVTRINKVGIIYIDSTDYGNWSANQISFKCSVANAEIYITLF